MRLRGPAVAGGRLPGIGPKSSAATLPAHCGSERRILKTLQHRLESTPNGVFGSAAEVVEEILLFRGWHLPRFP